MSLELLANTMEVGTIRRNRRQVAEIRRKTESGENGAFEDESRDDVDDGFEIMESVHPRMKYLTSPKPHTPSSIWEGKDGHHRGVLNDTFDPNDGSNSESESSFSSSEEAVQNCEGVLASLNINFDENCEAERSFEELELSPNDALYQQSSIGIVYTLPYYEDIVNASGYYYFVFGSENEKRDNFIRGRFDLEKLEYELPEPLQNCTNVKECHIPFEFASSQKVVVKIPQPPPHADDAWDRVYVAETECHPRTHLYMIFALLVPLVILLCAFQ
ncbi:hypothetical protein Ocin01_19412 [Orchesella cincta]|uniref:E3 ubiquitin-protein ligase APD1-4 middle domain-containing protein n=1 Tax=Orchesella cincta TaxID=48709 RepID=A0A1D2M2T0_ORCCI|nr:hypothetical protein Ocin01_19412 [Orchesella cincta]